MGTSLLSSALALVEVGGLEDVEAVQGRADEEAGDLRVEVRLLDGLLALVHEQQLRGHLHVANLVVSGCLGLFYGFVDLWVCCGLFMGLLWLFRVV